MKKISLVVPMLCALSLLVSVQPGIAQSAKESWQPFVFEKENFKVTLPVKPMESSETVETEIGRVPIRMFFSFAKPSHFTIMVADYPIIFDTPESAKETITRGIEAMVSRMQLNSRTQQEVQGGKYSWQEVRANVPGAVMSVRGLVVQNRMYLLMTMVEGQSLKSPSPAAISRFFDSFEFVKSPESISSTLPKVSQIESPDTGSSEPPPSFYEQPVSWREFSQPDFGFVVRLPSEPFKQTIKINPNDSRLDLHLWMAKGEGVLIYQAAFQQLLAAPNDQTKIKVLLDSFRDGIASGVGAKVTTEKQITLDSFPGREFKMQAEALRATTRIYLAGSRVYMLTVLNAVGEVGPKVTEEYFASFKVAAMVNSIAPASGALVEKTDWKEVVEPALGFKLMMPNMPQREVRPVYDLTVTTLTAMGDGVMCSIAHLFIPGPAPSKSETAQFFKNLSGGLVRAMNAEITSEKETTLDGYPGREYRLKKGTATGSGRAYLVNGHGYLLIALPTLSDGNERGISKFLESFRLTKIVNDDPPPPPPPPPPPMSQGGAEPKPKKINVSGGVLQEAAINKAQPGYPPEAKKARVQGDVQVQVLISEQGKVVEATIISGPEELRQVSLDAARQWEFKPTELSGVPVKVQGVLTFRFRLQ